jgi:hypothetical protein
MKTTLTIALLLCTATGLFAQTQTHRNGVTFSVAQASNEVAFRRLFGTQWAGLASLGYDRGTVFSTADLGSVEADSWGVGLAARRYFAPADLRPFAEAGGGVRWTDLPGCTHIRSPFASATGGVEYKVAERVSIEGNAGLTYSSISQRCEFNGITTNFNQHSLSTFRSALSLTFYF